LALHWARASIRPIILTQTISLLQAAQNWGRHLEQIKPLPLKFELSCLNGSGSCCTNFEMVCYFFVILFIQQHSLFDPTIQPIWATYAEVTGTHTRNVGD
jgi:hypothetical protein